VRTIEDGIEELQKLIECGVQYWLLGAGASFDAKIPLMYPLTERVNALILEPELSDLFNKIRQELPDSSHIEHVLSHIGDLIALATRSKSKKAYVGTNEYTTEQLQALHECIISKIAEIIRYGYKPSSATDAEEIGKLGNPIVEIEFHQAFIAALFDGRSNLEARSRVMFITTNYDTLLEDALTLARRSVHDGFSAGGIGYWIGHDQAYVETLSPQTHQLIKLHGSVDWLRAGDGTLVRGRYGTRYLSNLSETIIYPQATKYVETQRDPFANLFGAFRRVLQVSQSHVLCTVGYSFGDEHVNLEVQNQLEYKGNKTNVIAFVKEVPDGKPGTATRLPDSLERWRNNSQYGSRIYVASDKALYVGTERFDPVPLSELKWWSFSGLTTFLKTGRAL
jgi:hypothetical protein